ncbi:hypothetical protein QUF87_21970 [Lysinibacillus pakistanensis]|nr:hypothetical protein [Lysinibacillus pakistanensis]
MAKKEVASQPLHQFIFLNLYNIKITLEENSKSYPNLQFNIVLQLIISSSSNSPSSISTISTLATLSPHEPQSLIVAKLHICHLQNLTEMLRLVLPVPRCNLIDLLVYHYWKFISRAIHYTNIAIIRIVGKANFSLTPPKLTSTFNFPSNKNI